MHSLGIVQWDSTRRDHPGYPGRVSGSGLVISVSIGLFKLISTQKVLKICNKRGSK